MDKEKEIISQANEITNSMSPLDLVQKRCFYLIVQQVRKDYIETENPKKEYKDMTIHMTPENLARARDAKHITQAFESLKTLRNANFTIDTDDYMLNVGIINYAKYYKEKKIYEVQVSKEILPYLVDLSRRYFTSYNLTVAISLRHVSTQRFYELCNQYKHKAGMKFFIEADQLRNMLMLDGKYQKDAHLRKFVFGDLCFDYKPDEATKVGKKYTRYWIYIHTNETDQYQEQTFKQTQQQALYIYKVCLSVFKRDKKYCQRVYQWLDLHPDKIQEMFDKVTRWQKDYKGADLAKIIRFALKEDFGIQ